MPPRKTARSRRLGKQLRRAREDAQLSQETVVEHVNSLNPTRSLSTTILSRVESGLTRLETEQLGKLVEVLHLSRSAASELEDLRRRAGERGWWQEYSDIIPEPLEMLAEHGEDAITARTYDYAFVQGYLQTRAYAEAVVDSARAFVRPLDVDRHVDLRMRRQKRLGDPDFEGLTAVMAEDVLHRVVGGPPVMHEQLQHLLQLSRSATSKVTIQIYPRAAGALPGTDNLIIFTFPHPGDGEAVFVDSDTASRIYEDERDPIRQATYTFDAARAKALSARDSMDLIADLCKEYEQP